MAAFRRCVVALAILALFGALASAAAMTNPHDHSPPILMLVYVTSAGGFDTAFFVTSEGFRNNVPEVTPRNAPITISANIGIDAAAQHTPAANSNNPTAFPTATSGNPISPPNFQIATRRPQTKGIGANVWKFPLTV